jgi:hypothetical protein
MSDVCSFTLSHFRYCLELAKKLGYKFLTMSEYVATRDSRGTLPKKIIVMRHDIDHYLNLALNFADIEHSLAVKATYFVRLHAKYSITELDNYRILSKLNAQKHELGLHHDCDFASLVAESAEELFMRDKVIFESVINKKISGISSHEPIKSSFQITDNNLSRFGLDYQAYSDIFLKEMKYISDSSSRWREGCMCIHIKNEVPKLYILTHPIWWFNKSPLENY